MKDIKESKLKEPKKVATTGNEKKENKETKIYGNYNHVVSNEKIQDLIIFKKSSEGEPFNGEIISNLKSYDSDNKNFRGNLEKISEGVDEISENRDLIIKSFEKDVSLNQYEYQNKNLNEKKYNKKIQQNVILNNENVENYFEYKYNKSDFDGFQKEPKKEKKELSEFGTILLKEWYSDYSCDSEGSFNVSFEKLGYQKKKEIYDDIMDLLSQIINYINENTNLQNDPNYFPEEELVNHLKDLIKAKKEILNEIQLKEKYIFYKRDKNEEEDYSDPVFALKINYTENIFNIKEKIYEDIAKELLYFISKIYFHNFLYSEFYNMFRKTLKNYQMILLMEKMMENNEKEKNNSLENSIVIITFIDETIKNEKIFFLENTDNDLKTDKNYISFMEKNDLNDNNMKIYIDDKKYTFEKYFVPKNKGIEKITLSFKKNIISCRNMFYKCNYLAYINLSSLNSSEITDMSNMFYGCDSLININLKNNNNNNNNLKNISNIFYGCYNLIEINLSSFNTQNVTNMSYMFYGCKSLIFLNLSNFYLKYCSNFRNIVDQRMELIFIKFNKNYIHNFKAADLTINSIII